MARMIALSVLVAVGMLANWMPVDAATTTNGIGASREEWEGEHGEGEAGQTVVSYEDGRYYVAFQDGVVSFIEIGWEDTDGLRNSLAVTEVEDLLPSDARLVESIFFPATPAGPIGLVASRYESRSLPDLFPGDIERTTSIVAIFQLTGERVQSQPVVSRVSIAVGIEV